LNEQFIFSLAQDFRQLISLITDNVGYYRFSASHLNGRPNALIHFPAWWVW